MSALAPSATWFPDGKINAQRVAELSSQLQERARRAGYTRETFAASVAQLAESLTGMPAGADIDADVQRFVSERFLAVGIALSGGAN